MEVRGFLSGVETLADIMLSYHKDAMRESERSMRRIVTKWRQEAVKRVPRETGATSSSILTEVFYQLGVLTGAVGTNQVYAKWIEFGTKWIAGGRVKALGTRPDITDAQAIKDWPAKSATGTQTGTIGADGRVRDSRGKFVAGVGAEQMPWLRPAFMSIREWAINQIAEAFVFRRRR